MRQALCALDVEYGRIRTHMSEVMTVFDGTSAFTHVDVGDFHADNIRGRAYHPAVETINPVPQFEDMSTLRNKEPPLESPPHPLLIWERRDGGETTTSEEETSENDTWRMGSSEVEILAQAQGDVLGTSGESVVEPPAPKRVRRIELIHVPKRTYGLPPAQDQARGYGPPCEEVE
eukprot:3176087-Amphidinium_carterae.1